MREGERGWGIEKEGKIDREGHQDINSKTYTQTFMQSKRERKKERERERKRERARD